MTEEFEAGDAPSTTDAYVKTWLAETGVDLEMQVAGRLRRALAQRQTLWGVERGRPYFDQDQKTGEVKVRESDVVVAIAGYSRGLSQMPVTLYLVVECKSTDDPPWVAYRSERSWDLRQDDALTVPWRVSTQSEVTLSNIGGWFGSNLLDISTTAHSAVSSNRRTQQGSAKNYALTAAVQAVSAVRGQQQITQDKGSGHYGGFRRWASAVDIFVPVVVTAAPLYVVTSLADGTYTTGRTSRELLVGRFPGELNDLAVWIVHESAVDDLVADAIDLASSLDYRN